jgi:hypothetical protein
MAVQATRAGLSGSAGSSAPSLARPAISGRDWRLDVLRGMSLAFLAVNHTSLQTPLSHLTNGLFGYVSGAEIFVILAGFLLGTVHRRRFEREGWWPVAKRLWRRAGKIYLASLGASVVVFFLLWIPGINFRAVAVEGFLESTGNGYAHSGSLDLAVRFLTLNTGPWPINILALYVLLMVIAPVAVRILAWGRVAAVVLLAVSAGCWFLAQYSLLPAVPVQGQHAFPVWAWQFIFVIGLVSGWHVGSIRAFLRTRSGHVLVVIACVASVCFFTLRVYQPDASAFPFDRTTLQFGRVANLVVVVPVACLVLDRMPDILQRLLRILFEGAGRASLYVFLVHVLLLALIATAVQAWGNADPFLNTALILGMLAAIWLMVRFRVLFGIIPR